MGERGPRSQWTVCDLGQMNPELCTSAPRPQTQEDQMNPQLFSIGQAIVSTHRS